MSDIPNEGAIMWAELFKQRDELTRAQQALAQQVERLNDRVTQLATYCATVEKERDEARAEASFDALAKGARDVPCSGPCSESARCGACLAHANQAGLGRMLERTQNQRDAWAARFAIPFAIHLVRAADLVTLVIPVSAVAVVGRLTGVVGSRLGW